MPQGPLAEQQVLFLEAGQQQLVPRRHPLRRQRHHPSGVRMSLSLTQIQLE
jgi:RNase adaptor protein for sRNA GlmZ degradation